MRTLIYQWEDQFKDKAGNAFTGKGRQGDKDEEISRLKKEQEQVKEERDILKKPRSTLPENPGKIPIHQGLSRALHSKNHVPYSGCKPKWISRMDQATLIN